MLSPLILLQLKLHVYVLAARVNVILTKVVADYVSCVKKWSFENHMKKFIIVFYSFSGKISISAV